MDDDLLLQAILDLPIGTIANVIQSAAELEGTLSERLSKAYFEHTNQL